jgi:hypothetical protein
MTSPVLRTATLDSSPGPGNPRSSRRPLGTVALDLQGGSKGLLINSESLCGAPREAMVKMTGQNGPKANQGAKLETPFGKGAKHKRAGGTRASSPNQVRGHR